MLKHDILSLIRDRIHELKYEQVNLKLFIESDQTRHEQLEHAIRELELVHNRIKQLLCQSSSEAC
ncbi:MAG: hypothetical protein WAQ42_09520 [Limnochordia bacterium]|jgi:hypothetical protein